MAASVAAVAATTAAAASSAGAEIRQALTGLRQNIATLTRQCGLKKEPLLVAVSKTKPAEAIQLAYAAGCRHFGENYVQELVDKAALPSLSPHSCPGLVWHFIGHLQSNKCRAIARIPNLALVESVDSRKLATELNKACEHANRPERLPVLIQVNTSGEASKFGCAPAEAVDLYGHVLTACPHLEPRGLMTIGRLADTPQPDCFDLLVQIRDQICAAFSASKATAASAAATPPSSATPGVDASMFELSMGMSGDYPVAMERGATIVRIGSTIFGAREYPNKIPPPPPSPPPQEHKAEPDGK